MPTKFVLKQSLPKTPAASSPTLGEYVFDGGMFTVGSDEANSLVLSQIAPEQAVIVHEGDHLTLINSADGTRLNGQNLRREAIQPLANGDEILIGNYIVLVVDEETGTPSKNPAPIPPPSGVSLNGNAAAEDFISPLQTRIVQPETAPDKPMPPRNFASVLDTLRTEEDSFYFVVRNGTQETGRIPLEQTETPIGTNDKGAIAFNIEQILTPLAVARKDWSGILIEARRRNSVFVNDEAVDTVKRLRNDDRVSFSAPVQFSLVLHEPSLLVALEPFLSARSSANGSRAGDAATGKQTTALTAATKNVPLLERRFFGYFSFVEVLTMVIGTLIGAILFFLFFEFMFS